MLAIERDIFKNSFEPLIETWTWLIDLETMLDRTEVD